MNATDSFRSTTDASAGNSDFPLLLADVGGTNARFALETAPGLYEAVTVFPNADYPSLVDAMHAYLSQPAAAAAGAGLARHAAFAIANPVEGDIVRMTNSKWVFSIETVRRQFGLDTFRVVNDFTALAMAVPLLAPRQIRQVGGGAVVSGKAIGVLGAGTGLGVSGLIPAGGQWIALESEGGHVTFPPADERDAELLRHAWERYPHVSAERLLSGMGLELTYRIMADRSGKPAEALPAPEIARRALAGECEICDGAIEQFCAMLGTVAGNLALTLGAKGGIYIGGGIVPRLGKRFTNSSFRHRFEQKGRFCSYLEKIPTFVITEAYPAFIGISALLARR